MEKIFINSHGEDFVIHIEQSSGYFKEIIGEVFPIKKYFTSGQQDEKWGYVKSFDGNIHEAHDPDESCRKFYEFSYCWRGCWEGRVYFKDDEFWSEELAQISDIWTQILPKLKKIIISFDPDYGAYDD